MGNYKKIKIGFKFQVSSFKFQVSSFKFHVSGLMFFVVFAMILMSPNTVGAVGQVGISVSPQMFEIGVFPGETISREINIRNSSQVPLPISIRVIDFSAQEGSGDMIFDEYAQDRSITSWKWFEIESSDIILEPGERRKIEFSINIPEDAELRGYYSMMMFEPRLPSFYFEEHKITSGYSEWSTSPRAIPIIGAPFLISIKGLVLEPETSEKLEVVEFSLPKEERILTLENVFSKIMGDTVYATDFNIIEKSPSNFILRIKNNDAYHVKSYGKISIYNIFGKKIGESDVSPKTILPGKTRSFSVNFFPETSKYLEWLPPSVSDFIINNLFIGKYQARLELEAKTPISVGVFKPSAPFVLTFFSLPWQFWLSFVLIFSLLIFLIIRYRKRLFLAIRAVIKP